MLRRYAWDLLMYGSLYLNRYIVYNIFTCVNEAHLSHDVHKIIIHEYEYDLMPIFEITAYIILPYKYTGLILFTTDIFM